jgi:hypothetical protein
VRFVARDVLSLFLPLLQHSLQRSRSFFSHSPNAHDTTPRRYYASGGEQVKISGCVIEGNGGPGVIAMGIVGLTLVSNYFEANNGYEGRTPVTMYPATDNTTAPPIVVNADIVLNGAPSFHDGNSDYRTWTAPLRWTYGRSYPPRSVLIQGNTHAPTVNGTAVLAIACNGLVLTANGMSRENQPGWGVCNHTSVALVETGSDSKLFSVTGVTMTANTGFTACTLDDTLLNRGLVRLRPTTKPFNGGVGLDTWRVTDSPASPADRHRNLVRHAPCTGASTPSSGEFAMCPVGSSAWAPVGPDPKACVVTHTSRAMYGYGVLSIGSFRNNLSVCMVPVLSVNLTATAFATDAVALRGQAVFVHVTYSVTQPHTGLSLAVFDPDTGVWTESASPRVDRDESGSGWHVATYQTTLAHQGVAMVALHVASEAVSLEDVVEVGSIVVARVGAEWSTLLSGFS